VPEPLGSPYAIVRRLKWPPASSFGAGAVAGFRIILAKRPDITLPVQSLIRAAVILLTLLYEERWPVEQVLWDVAGFLRFLAPMCG
jgi:hypothetical protein